MYLIYGPEKYLAQEFIDKLKKQDLSIDLANFYWSDESNVKDLIDLISQNSLFGFKRLICIYDCPYWEAKIAKSESHWANKLAHEIDINTEDTVVFINNSLSAKDKIPFNSFTNKMMQSNIEFFFANTLSGANLRKQIEVIANNHGAKIDNLAINSLISKLPNDLNLINHELIKLSHLSPTITVENIEKTVSDVYVEDVFGFSNSIDSNDFNLIWRKYKEKTNEGVEIYSLIAQISQLLVLAHQIYCFLTSNQTLNDIANKLKINQFRVKKVYGFLKNTGINKINAMIKSLALIDQEIKFGQTNEVYAFEQFLIKYFH